MRRGGKVPCALAEVCRADICPCRSLARFAIKLLRWPCKQQLSESARIRKHSPGTNLIVHQLPRSHALTIPYQLFRECARIPPLSLEAYSPARRHASTAFLHRLLRREKDAEPLRHSFPVLLFLELALVCCTVVFCFSISFGFSRLLHATL